jgi:cation:H+ antiporter
MNAILLMLAGFVCAGLGGELFVRGAVGIARRARIPAGIVGATVAAFATSSPELAVALVSASEGTPTVSFGNLLGANIVNVGFALGLAVAIGGLKTTRARIGRDYGVAVVAPIATGLLLLDGGLSRIDGVVLLGFFFAWLAITVHEARRQRSAAAAVLGERGGRGRTLAITGLGLVLLIIAGELVVSGAHGVGDALGLDPFVVGATLVAVGTTLPELATLVISRLRGHDEVGLGTVLGSNVFNGLFIVGLVAVLSPFEVPIAEAGIPVILGALLVALIYPSPSGRIERRRGFALLALYVVHLAALLQFRGG